MGEKFSSCVCQEVIPNLDFLHSKTIYQTNKYSTYSKSGIVLSFLMILTFIGLFIYVYYDYKKIHL